MAHSSSPGQASPPGRRYLLLCALGGVVLIALVVVGLAWWSPSGDDSAPTQASPSTAITAPSVDLASLPESTTHTTLEDAPMDTGPPEPTDGTVVHPPQEVPVFAAPEGAAVARIGPEQIGQTWLPVIAEQPGWVQVLLPSRPNGSTGWLRTDGLERATSPYLVRVHLRSHSMELFRDGRLQGEWTIGIGKESAPTPPGRTFLLGSFTDREQTYSPVILPLGAHSPTLDTFGGGPGTVAIHTWPTDDVFGTRSSDGCIRVPADALEQLTEVPLGTLVLIDEE